MSTVLAIIMALGVLANVVGALCVIGRREYEAEMQRRAGSAV